MVEEVTDHELCIGGPYTKMKGRNYVMLELLQLLSHVQSFLHEAQNFGG